MKTLSSTPASADACTGTIVQRQTSALAPAFEYRMAASDDYTEHQKCDVQGFCLVDATHGRASNSAPERELLWVGLYGEGRWLRPEEVLELAAALEHMANSHIERIANSHLARLTQAGGATC